MDRLDTKNNDERVDWIISFCIIEQIDPFYHSVIQISIMNVEFLLLS